MNYPSSSEFRCGVLAFRKNERRDAMYRVASFLVDHFWGNPRELADAVGVLLLTWNQAHYRYGPPDFERLERLLATDAALLRELRARDISTLSEADHATVTGVFRSALGALEIADGKSRGRRSPVAVAKALHLLAPRFFPLWDAAIALAYGCYYAASPAEKYLDFMRIQADIATRLRDEINSLSDGKTSLKVIDEYNYAKFTKRWV